MQSCPALLLCEDVIYVQSNVIGYDHLLEKAIDNKSQAQSYSAEGELLGILYLVKELFGSDDWASN